MLSMLKILAIKKLKENKMFQLFKKKAKTKLYTRCNELVIHNFNEAMNGNLEYLKIDKTDNVSNSELETVWLSILDEFLVLSRNNLALKKIKDKITILKLQAKLRVLEILKFCVDRNIKVDETLNQYKTSKEKIQVHLGMLKNDISRLTPKETDSDNSNNSNDFEKSIAILIKNGCAVDRHKMVVSTWCELLNLLQEQAKLQKN